MIDSNNPQLAWMKFNAAIIPYKGNDDWVEPALYRAKAVLQLPICPEHSENCEHGRFLQ
tara:strand:- start:967 stop:1143 length:177 start_codon:yes stop_codon:yes gene_type:complete